MKLVSGKLQHAPERFHAKIFVSQLAGDAGANHFQPRNGRPSFVPMVRLTESRQILSGPHLFTA